MSSTPPTRLFLLRHAHSSLALPGQKDHERGLDRRGEDEARTVARFIEAEAIRFDRIVCSSATRAKATLDLLFSGRTVSGTIERSDALYAHGTDAYLEALAKGGRSILMVGHNPMMEEFALSLAGSGTEEVLARLRRSGFPTCALAIFDFDCEAKAILAGSGRLRELIDPAEL